MTTVVKCDLCNKMFTGVVTPQETQSGCTDFAIKAQCANATIFLVKGREVFIYRVNLCALKNVLFKGVKKINKSIFLKRLV